MLAGQLGLILAAVFTGAAVVISVAEQPARLLLNHHAMLTHWISSYLLAARMLGGLALISCLCGLAAFWWTRDWRWLIGSGLIFANWPYTLVVMMPVNGALYDRLNHKASFEIRTLVERWGRLHLLRCGFGAAATVAYLWALY